MRSHRTLFTLMWMKLFSFPFVRLVTSGMSDLPMLTAHDAGAPRFAELISIWPLDQEFPLKNEVSVLADTLVEILGTISPPV